MSAPLRSRVRESRARAVDIAANAAGGAFSLTLGRLVVGFTVLLLLYLPVEHVVLAALPEALFWPLRLLPDAVIAGFVALVLARHRGSYEAPHRLLLLILAAGTILLVVTALRGLPVADGVNALRVLLRYPLLAVLVWRFVRDVPGIDRILLGAMLAAGIFQVLAGWLEVADRLIGGAAAGQLFLVEGTVGRYDRFGLLLAAFVGLLLARQSGRIWLVAPSVLVGVLPLLFLASSRHAMLGLAAAGMLAALLPRVRAPQRALAVAVTTLCLLMVVASPSRVVAPVQPALPGIGSPGGSPPPTVVVKDRGVMSLDPNRNFRLYLTFVLTPWAVSQEPLTGFGPLQHRSADADPRLREFVKSSGMAWSWAKRFMDDSNYATLLIQFGIPATLAFLALLLVPLGAVLRRAVSSTATIVRYAALSGCTVLVAAFFGPAFEIRVTSIILWVFLFAALGLTGSRSWSGQPLQN